MEDGPLLLDTLAHVLDFGWGAGRRIGGCVGQLVVALLGDQLLKSPV